MSRVRTYRGVAVLAALSVLVIASARPARAALAGHPSYSANLSANASIRKQQLICDPVGSVYRGSTSTLYQPGLVSLSTLLPVQGFDIVNSYVEVRPFGGQNIEPVKINGPNAWLINTSDYFSHGGGATFTETGYLQTFFQRSPGSVDPTVKNPDTGFTFLAEDGFRDPDTGKIQGDDTHYMFFDLKPGVPVDAPSYTDFADQGSRGLYPAAGPQVDSITALLASGGPGQTITAGIDSATVPEPAGVLFVGASGLILLRRRRRCKGQV
jgi:hypothetical protein